MFSGPDPVPELKTTTCHPSERCWCEWGLLWLNLPTKRNVQGSPHLIGAFLSPGFLLGSMAATSMKSRGLGVTADHVHSWIETHSGEEDLGDPGQKTANSPPQWKGQAWRRKTTGHHPTAMPRTGLFLQWRKRQAAFRGKQTNKQFSDH